MSRNPAKIGRNLLISVLKKNKVYISKYKAESTVGLTPKSHFCFLHKSLNFRFFNYKSWKNDYPKRLF